MLRYMDGCMQALPLSTEATATETYTAALTTDDTLFVRLSARSERLTHMLWLDTFVNPSAGRVLYAARQQSAGATYYVASVRTQR